jgi:hypothetical protein
VILYRAAEALESRAADFTVERGEIEDSISVLADALSRLEAVTELKTAWHPIGA